MSSRPARSDEHLPPEDEVRLTEETREYFDGIAPKRHTKPQRSGYSGRYSDALPPSGGDGIPELDRFWALEVDTEKLVCEGSEAREEFVEMEYYKELSGIDKQHHMIFSPGCRSSATFKGKTANCVLRDITVVSVLSSVSLQVSDPHSHP